MQKSAHPESHKSTKGFVGALVEIYVIRAIFSSLAPSSEKDSPSVDHAVAFAALSNSSSGLFMSGCGLRPRLGFGTAQKKISAMPLVRGV